MYSARENGLPIALLDVSWPFNISSLTRDGLQRRLWNVDSILVCNATRCAYEILIQQS